MKKEGKVLASNRIKFEDLEPEKKEDLVFFDPDKVKILEQNPILLKFFDGNLELLRAFIAIEMKD